MIAALLALALLLQGCDSRAAVVSPLQRINWMRAPLLRQSALSVTVSRDMQRLGRALQESDPAAVRKAAVPLRHDAHALSSGAGHSAYPLRRMHVSAHAVQLWLRHIELALTHEWYEGRALQQLAALTWQDPYLARGNDLQTFRSLVRWAMQESNGAVQETGQAAWIRSHHRAAFRYHPLKRKKR